MRYTGAVTDVFAHAIARNFEDALRLMEAAVAACPDELWRTDLWPDEPSAHAPPPGAVGGSAPWFLAYHALSCLDYDLTGDFERWQPPAPFHEHVWGWPSRVFTKDEVLGYLAWCRDRSQRTLGALTDEAAARPLPDSHRYRGTQYGVMIAGIPVHVVEHAAQVRQFLASASTRPQPPR
jgi:hypothetical protein